MQCEAVASTPDRPNFGQQRQRHAVQGSNRYERHGGSLAADNPPSRTPPSSQHVDCIRTRRTAEQCKNYAMRGTTVCRKHAGTAPQAQNKARARLLEMVDPANMQLHRIPEKDTTTDAHKLRAITVVLGRRGYGREAKLGVEVKPYEKLMDGLNIRPPEAELAAGAEQEDPNIIDAEVVEDAESATAEPRLIGQQVEPDRRSDQCSPYIVGSDDPRRS